MRIKKMLLLASMALAAMAVAIPAAASAEPALWTHEHKVLTSGTPSSPYEGFAKFEIPGVFSFGCEITVRLQAEPGTTGTVTEFKVTTTTCKGTGAAAACELGGDHPENLPWTVHTTTHDLEITDVTILNTYKAGCGLGAQTTLHFPKITAEIDNATTIHSVTLSGVATNTAVASGTLTIESPDVATIGIQTK